MENLGLWLLLCWHWGGGCREGEKADGQEGDGLLLNIHVESILKYVEEWVVEEWAEVLVEELLLFCWLMRMTVEGNISLYPHVIQI